MMRHHRGGDRRVILRGVTYTDRLGEGVDLLEMVCDASCLMKQENGLSIGALYQVPLIMNPWALPIERKPMDMIRQG